MNLSRQLSLCAVVAIAGACSFLAPSAPAASGDDTEVVGRPVYQPMLVVGMPRLREPEPQGRVLESFAARNSPVADVLLAMFKDSDINLWVDEAVQGASCTFDIKKATVEQAFESLLRSLDLGYEWDGNFLRVRPTVRDTLFVDLLGSGEGGAGSGEGSSTGDVAAAGADFWTEIQRMLPELVGDRGRALVNEAASTIHVEASPATVERVREVVDTTLRRRNTQVSIEARILEVRLDDQHNLGVNWSLLPGILNSTRTGLASGGAIVSQTAASGSTAFNFGVFDDDQYSVFVDALEKQGQVRVLSSPRVSTMNHEPASIRVADQIPVISREVITDQGVARSEFSVSFVEAGVVVQVTPMIGEDGMITVRVAPEVTEQTGTVVTPDGLVTQPILSSRSAQTIVRVADGQAVVIGGLRKTRKDETLQGVPFLMDLPVLGQVFSSTVQSRQEVELMIVVVPRVLDAAWMEEEVRRGAHRLVSLRRPYRFNSIGLDSHRPEDWSGGVHQGTPAASSAPDVRRVEPSSEAQGAGASRTITRAGLCSRLLERAQTSIEDGQIRQALVWIDEALDLEPRRVDALVTGGVLLDRLGLQLRARTLLDRALGVAPDDPVALTARAALELQGGSAPAARRMLERVHAIDPSPASASNLGAALLLCSEFGAARDLLRSLAGDAAAVPPELHANLAYAELVLGDESAARDALAKALRAGVDPRNPRVMALVKLMP
ncbi:MAG: hypothetical protein AB7O97_18545 [Planctomycetota bacterium]